MFIIKLSQHVSGIIMPIIRRTLMCTAAYGVLVEMAVAVWSWDASCVHTAWIPAPHSHSHHYQNTIRGSAHYCSPDDGHNDARNMLR